MTPPHNRGHALHPGPYPPDLSRWNSYGALTTDSSRAPSRLACRTRAVWQYRHVPSLSGLLPPLPAPPGSGCPQLQPDRCDDPAAESFHLRTVMKRLVAHGFHGSARMRCGRAGCPLYPGGDGVPRDHRDIRDRRLPPCNGWPLPPRYRTPTRDVRLTRHQQGFRVIHPSGLPLTCNTRSERAPSGFPLSFAPGRYQPRTSGRGRVWNTNPKSRPRHHAEPPIDELTHNVRHRVAASCHAAPRT